MVLRSSSRILCDLLGDEFLKEEEEEIHGQNMYKIRAKTNEKSFYSEDQVSIKSTYPGRT